MGKECKGVCSRYKPDRVPGSKRYKDGVKRCTLCERYIQTEERDCPCCHARLSTRAVKGPAVVKRIESDIDD